MNPIDLLFLIPVFVIGALSSFTDIKYGKIKNNLILLGFIWAFSLYSGLILYFLFLNPNRQVVSHLIPEMALNGSIAFGLGYLLWQLKLWAAGDAKLFSLYAFLTPLSFYSFTYYDYFPSFVVLINTFFLILLLLVFQLLFFCFKKTFKSLTGFKKEEIISRRKLLKKDDVWQKLIKKTVPYLSLFLVFFTLKMLISLTSRSLNTIIDSGHTFIFLSLFYFRRLLMKHLLKSKMVMIIIIFTLSAYSVFLILNSQTVYLLNSLKTAIVFFIPMILLMKVFSFYLKEKEIKKVKIQDLKPNMIISAENLQRIMQKDNIHHDYSGTLNSEEIKSLKKLFRDDPETEIEVYKTFAFAPFMFLAWIITLLIKGSLIIFIINFLS